MKIVSVYRQWASVALALAYRVNAVEWPLEMRGFLWNGFSSDWMDLVERYESGGSGFWNNPTCGSVYLEQNRPVSWSGINFSIIITVRTRNIVQSWDKTESSRWGTIKHNFILSTIKDVFLLGFTSNEVSKLWQLGALSPPSGSNTSQMDPSRFRGDILWKIHFLALKYIFLCTLSV